MAHIFRASAAAAGVALTLAATGVAAQEASPHQTLGDRCIRISRIFESQVIDEQTVILDMRGGPDLKMELADKCPGLRNHRGFSYSSSIDRLCAHGDVIRAIRDSHGLGSTCAIASFTPLTADESAALKASRRGGGGEDDENVDGTQGDPAPAS